MGYPDDRYSTVMHHRETETSQGTTRTIGAVAGRIQPVHDRDASWFLLLDPERDVEVQCHADAALMDLARTMAGQLVCVEGWLSRDGVTGRPLSMNPVMEITALPEVTSGSFRAARGVAPVAEGSILPEEAIRRMRDASMLPPKMPNMRPEASGCSSSQK